jgi:hypothetical protein
MITSSGITFQESFSHIHYIRSAEKRIAGLPNTLPPQDLNRSVSLAASDIAGQGAAGRVNPARAPGTRRVFIAMGGRVGQTGGTVELLSSSTSTVKREARGVFVNTCRRVIGWLIPDFLILSFAMSRWTSYPRTIAWLALVVLGVLVGDGALSRAMMVRLNLPKKPLTSSPFLAKVQGSAGISGQSSSENLRQKPDQSWNQETFGHSGASIPVGSVFSRTTHLK